MALFTFPALSMRSLYLVPSLFHASFFDQFGSRGLWESPERSDTIQRRGKLREGVFKKACAHA